MKKVILVPENFSFPLGTEGMEVYVQTLKNLVGKELEVAEESFGTYTIKYGRKQTLRVSKTFCKII